MMNLIEPQRTQWDLQFYIVDIPVRVHPMFWIMGLILGANGSFGIQLLLWILALFVSILIHELGHAFVMQAYGERARIVLYWMGGLAISGGDIWDLGYRSQRRTPQQQIIISFAGPAAGFVLAGLVAGVVYLTGGSITTIWTPLPFMLPVYGDEEPSPDALYMMTIMLYINVFWGLVNLLPVFPLDGGQIARQLLILNDPWHGITRSLWLSLIVGGGVALYALASGNLWGGMLFGSMAFGSWQMLQNTGQGGRPW